MDIRRVLATNIRAEAKRKGVGISALADFAGVSRSQLYDVLGRETSPSIDWVAKVAKALELEAWELLRKR